MLILIVDDERMVRITMRSMLEQLYPNKHTFLEAKSGIEAINIISKYSPNMAFVDYKIPIKNGVEVIREASQFCKNVKWVLLSGYDRSVYKDEIGTLEIADFLLKPASLKDIESVVEKRN